MSVLEPPRTDPTDIFEIFRGAHGTELLVVAAAHFDLFTRLAKTPMTFHELRAELDLERRPAVVLITALRAMGLLGVGRGDKIMPTLKAAEHLVRGGHYDVSDYLGLAAKSPGVLDMLERLKTNRPAGANKPDQGAAYIYREGIDSAMETEPSARHLTLALAGRAKNVAPMLAQNFSLEGVERLLDVGGGTGIYSIAYLMRYPKLRATIFDRPEVLKVAQEFAEAHGVADRMELHVGDMFKDALPQADAVLLSNVLHDWDVPDCHKLVERCAQVLAPGGLLMIHDVFLTDEMDGPLPIALYSASLFSLTEGRAYSRAEFRQMLAGAGLTPSQTVVPTLVHCGVLSGIKDA